MHLFRTKDRFLTRDRKTEFSESTGMLEFDSLPDLAREHVLKFLAGEKDVKVCRLVCKEWYNYFDRSRIRDKEHFVFRWNVTRSDDEINEIMLGYRGSGVNIDLVEVPLEKLRFQDFGDKIRGIRVCVYDTVFGEKHQQALLNMLTHTLNIRYFHCLDTKKHRSNSDRERSIEQNPFPMIIAELHARNLRFNELRQFDTTLAFLYPRELYHIFPHLESLRSKPMHLRQLVHSGLPIKEDLTEFGKINVHMENLRSLKIERNFLLCAPKLKKLAIGFRFDLDSREGSLHNGFRFDSDSRQGSQSSLDTCLNFFTHQTELETLSISFKCTCDHASLVLHPSTDEHKEYTNGGDAYCAAKQLLFHILRSCAKLRVLHLKLRCTKLQFSAFDVQEFVRLTRPTKIRDLTFPLDVLDRAALHSHFASLDLESLKLHGLKLRHQDYVDDVRLMTDCFEGLSEFLHFNENLIRMRVQTTLRQPGMSYSVYRRVYPDIVYFTGGLEELQWSITHHNKLEHLAIDFHFEVLVEGVLFLEYLMSLELPRLSSLKLGKKRQGTQVFELVHTGTEERFAKWIQKMPQLKIVYLNVMNVSVEQLLKMCKPLPNLQVLSFSNYKIDKRTQAHKGFQNLPVVKTVWHRGLKFTRDMFVDSGVESSSCRAPVTPDREISTVPLQITGVRKWFQLFSTIRGVLTRCLSFLKESLPPRMKFTLHA